MHGNIAGLFYSLAIIAASVALSLIFEKFCKAPYASAVARKIVHIGVSNFHFVYYYCFDNIIFPLGGLFSFAVLNFIKEFNDRKKGKGSTSWGTVEFPLVVCALVITVALGFGTKEMLGCALLGMGYGDGLAAVFGNIFGKRKMIGHTKKTIIGSVVCFIVVSFIVYLILRPSVWLCALIGFISMLVEAYTPFNLDNVTLPAIIFGLVRVLC